MAVCCIIFQSTLPIQGETRAGRCSNYQARISIHSPYTGRDACNLDYKPSPALFQSTLPIQGETIFLEDAWKRTRNFNPLSLYRERRSMDITWVRKMQHFNPLSLYRERRSGTAEADFFLKFQSTLPIQGETDTSASNCIPVCISIHSPYTGRDR